MKKSKKIKTKLYGSSKFTEADVSKGFKVCYDASDLSKMDDVMNAKMKHMKTRENHMSKMEY